jgi:predicted transcriptional regulator
MTIKSVAVDVATYDRLRHLADSEDRPISRIVKRAVQAYERPEPEVVPDGA